MTQIENQFLQITNEFINKENQLKGRQLVNVNAEVQLGVTKAQMKEAVLNISRLFEQQDKIHKKIAPVNGSVTEFEMYPGIDFFFKIDIEAETKSPV